MKLSGGALLVPVFVFATETTQEQTKRTIMFLRRSAGTSLSHLLFVGRSPSCLAALTSQVARKTTTSSDNVMHKNARRHASDHENDEMHHPHHQQQQQQQRHNLSRKGASGGSILPGSSKHEASMMSSSASASSGDEEDEDVDLYPSMQRPMSYSLEPEERSPTAPKGGTTTAGDSSSSGKISADVVDAAHGWMDDAMETAVLESMIVQESKERRKGLLKHAANGAGGNAGGKSFLTQEVPRNGSLAAGQVPFGHKKLRERERERE